MAARRQNGNHQCHAWKICPREMARQFSRRNRFLREHCEEITRCGGAQQARELERIAEDEILLVECPQPPRKIACDLTRVAAKKFSPRLVIVGGAFEERAQLARPRRVSQLPQCLCFNLPN